MRSVYQNGATRWAHQLMARSCCGQWDQPPGFGAPLPFPVTHFPSLADQVVPIPEPHHQSAAWQTPRAMRLNGLMALVFPQASPAGPTRAETPLSCKHRGQDTTIVTGATPPTVIHSMFQVGKPNPLRVVGWIHHQICSLHHHAARRRYLGHSIRKHFCATVASRGKWSRFDGPGAGPGMGDCFEGRSGLDSR